MAFILPTPHVFYQPVRVAPQCKQHASSSSASRMLRVAAIGIAAAGVISGSQAVDAIELPQLPFPSIPSVSLPQLPGLPKFGSDPQPKDAPTDLSQEEEGKVDDMMARLQAKKKAQAAKM